MKTTYSKGKYWVKIRGRGLTCATLTKAQAKALFEFQRKGFFEIEGVSYGESEPLLSL